MSYLREFGKWKFLKNGFGKIDLEGADKPWNKVKAYILQLLLYLCA